MQHLIVKLCRIIRVMGSLRDLAMGLKSEVRPAVHHSRPQARDGFQMLPHKLSEGTYRG